jgi:hypothetical protein
VGQIDGWLVDGWVDGSVSVGDLMETQWGQDESDNNKETQWGQDESDIIKPA